MRTRSSIVLGVVGAIALGLIGVLSAEVKALRLYERQVRRMRNFPHIGQWFPTVKLVTASSDTLLIGETVPNRAQLLVFFNIKCEFCRASLPMWKSLSDSLLADKTHRFDVVWITHNQWDSTASYANVHGLHYSIAKFVDPKIPMVLKARSVPLTVVLDRFGRVEHLHSQALTDSASFDSLFIAAYRATTADSMLTASRVLRQVPDSVALKLGGRQR